MAGDLVFSSYALLPIVFYVCYNIFARLTKPTDAFDVLPWVGLPKGRFAKLRARYIPGNCRDVIGDAFKKYNLRGMSFVFPTFLGSPRIVLPGSQVQWLIDQPDHVLSFKDAVADNLSLQITSLSPEISKNPIHHDVIKGTLTRSLAMTSSLVLDELRESFNANWGEDGLQWTDHVVWESMTKIFAQTSGRIFIGTPLCRNNDFLHEVVKYAECIIETGTKIRAVPEILKPLLGYFITSPNRAHFNKIYEHVGPIVDQRKAEIASAAQSHNLQEDEEPFDLLQWSIHRALESSDPLEIDTVMICKRFAIVCFAAIHTTSLTSTNLLLDLITADKEHDTMAKLRQEVVEVQRQNHGKWDKPSLSKLVLMDSAIRESQRMHSAGSWALHRKVKAKEGLTMPDGVWAPCGADLSIAGYHLQRDESIYEDPNKFDPFRFSRSREAFASSNGQLVDASNEPGPGGRTAQILKDRNAAAISTGPTHLPFGHGRHACPGRFFAIQEVKLMLVHVLLNYEVQPLDQRPPNPWYRDLMSPNTKASISVKKVAPPV